MDMRYRYDGYRVAVKGRLAVGLSTQVDVGGSGILLDQGTILGTPSTLSLSSSSVNDAALGTGARTVLVVGFGETGIYQEELVTMNGYTPVVTTKKFLRHFLNIVKSLGSLDGNAGIIYTVKTGTGGTYTNGVPGVLTAASLTCVMLAGTNQGTSCFYTTPNAPGKKWILTGIGCSCATQAGLVFIQTKDWANSSPALREFYVNLSPGVPFDKDLRDLNIQVGPLTDVRVLAMGTGMAVNAYLTLEIM